LTVRSTMVGKAFILTPLDCYIQWIAQRQHPNHHCQCGNDGDRDDE